MSDRSFVSPRRNLLAAALPVVAGLLLWTGASTRAAAPPGQYTVAADTVLDNRTDLVWQRQVAPGTYTWLNALSYCEGLTLDGHTDWRLPNVKELQTIVDEATFNPAIDTTAFPNTPSEFFWSSSPYADDANDAWGVGFSNGYTDRSGAAFDDRVRCVR